MVTNALSPELGLECVISKKRSISRYRGCWLAVANVLSDADVVLLRATLQRIEIVFALFRDKRLMVWLRGPSVHSGRHKRAVKNKQSGSEEHANGSAFNPNVCMFVCDRDTLGYLAFSS